MFDHKGRRRLSPASAKGLLAALAVATCYLGGTRSASAAASERCGSSTPNWNVPNGGLFLRRVPDGMLAASLTSAGLYWTHSAISNGQKGSTTWVTQAEFDDKEVGKRLDCDVVLDPNQLAKGMPGGEQVNIGGFFKDTFGDGHPGDGRGVDYVWHSGNNPNDDWGFDVDSVDPNNPWVWVPGGSDRGAKAADFFWSGITTPWVTSKYDSSQGYYSLNWADNPSEHIPYRLNQFMNIGLVGRKQQPGDIPLPPSYSGGVVCSTLLAYGQYQSSSTSINTGAGNVTHAQLATGLQSLYDSVYNSCRANSGWTSGLDSFAWHSKCIWTGDNDPCDDIAAQVLNCFTSGRCDTNEGSIWQSVARDANAIPNTVSPDCLAGRGHCFNTGGGSSAWAWDNDRDVIFSGSGSTYGCWE